VGAGLGDGESEGSGLGDAAALGLGEGESEGAGLASGEGEGDASGEADGLGEGEASGLGAGVSLGIGLGAGESEGVGLTSGLGAGVSLGLGLGAGESEGVGLTSGDGDGAVEGSGDGAGDELGAGDGLGDGSAASAATGANRDTTIKVACRNASARRRRSAGRNPDMLDTPSPDAASGRAGSFGTRRGVGVEIQDEKETISAGARNSTNALDGGSGRDRYSLVLRKPRFGLPMVQTVTPGVQYPGDSRCLDAPPQIHPAQLHRRGAHQTAQYSCLAAKGT
jgi:hypothetical protein